MAEKKHITLGGRLKFKIISAKQLSPEWGSEADPYVVILLDGKSEGKTTGKDNEANPVWNEVIEFEVDQAYEKCELVVWDNNTAYPDRKIGIVNIDLKAVEASKGEITHTDVELTHPKGKAGFITYSLSYVQSGWEIKSNYPAHKHNKVTLYQSAHVDHHDPIPQYYDVNTDKTHNNFVPESACWEEIYKKILGAKVFVYITGAWFHTGISFVRRKRDGYDTTTIGEVLKQKAKEGVTVMVHIWDPADSFSIGNTVFSKASFANAHDEETFQFFKGTGVICDKSPRNTSTYNPIANLQSNLIWCHHQKTVICDEECPRDAKKRKRIIGFVGGIDLTDGRFETPRKSGFKHLQTDYKDDFYQNMIVGVDRNVGPREPWQDIHAKVEGPTARDLLDNFVQRWKMQASGTKKHLVNTNDLEVFLPAELDVYTGKDEWTSQVFRSIDQYSIKKSGKEADIQEAYINAIRLAKNYIYIENQFFVTSSPEWNEDGVSSSDEEDNCPNEIGLALANKIIQKIERKEPFRVYICIPMWSEGIPTSVNVQTSLHFQTQTIRMLYRKIGLALKTHKSDAHPLDYLSFYCLANRESGDPQAGPAPAAQTRRFPIYVHSKLMIVDDEYVILGSANINERSMSGNRDTEIAMGSYQPNVTNHHGGVHAFRMQLWGEHFGISDKRFVDPVTKTTWDAVRHVSEENWKVYVADEIKDMKGHIVPYPIDISKTGLVTARDGYINFPDTTAAVLGTPTAVLSSHKLLF